MAIAVTDSDVREPDVSGVVTAAGYNHVDAVERAAKLAAIVFAEQRVQMLVEECVSAPECEAALADRATPGWIVPPCELHRELAALAAMREGLG